MWLLIVTLALSSVAGLFYYLRIISCLYSKSIEPSSLPGITLTGGIVLAALTWLLLWIGLYPGPLIEGIKAMVGKFS